MAVKLRLKALVADNEQGVLSSMQQLLDENAAKLRLDLSIDTTLSSSEVLKRLGSNHYDMVILDHHFNGDLSGGEILEDVASKFAPRRVVLMSSRPFEELAGPISKGTNSLGNSFDYLSKPFNEKDVFSLLQKARVYFSRAPYPVPIAMAQRRFAAAGTGSTKFHGLVDISESICKVVCSIFLVELRKLARGGELTDPISWNGVMTFGAWLKLWQVLADLLDPSSSKLLFPDVHQATTASRIKLDGRCRNVIEVLYQFKEIRDKNVTHAHTAEDGWYEGLVEQWKPRIEAVLQECISLTRSVFVAVDDSRYSPIDEEATDYQLSLLMGAPPPPEKLSLTCPERLIKDHIYIANEVGQFAHAFPLLLRCMCTQCRKSHTYTISEFNDNSITYMAADCAASISVPDARKAFATAFPNAS